MDAKVWTEKLKGLTVSYSTLDTNDFRYQGIVHSVIEHEGKLAVIIDDRSLYSLIPDHEWNWSVQVGKSDDRSKWVRIEEPIIGAAELGINGLILHQGE